ncbi:hypothetical protein [Cumulibacter soli]|uniref:hypothetical protein n=1 Tax=Cumulibacter soli TaxID=2546344 RepID=UPI0010688FC8|nr:hypothetical protein [Cumulibacter soli]
MSFLRAWTQHATQTGLVTDAGQPGIQSFWGRQPHAPVDCVTWWLEPTGQPASLDTVVTADIRGVVRHAGTESDLTEPGRALAENLLRALGDDTRSADTTITDPDTGTTYLLTQALPLSDMPTPLGPDESGNAHEWSLVLRVTYSA